MEDFSLEDLDTDILDFFSDDLELRRQPEEGEFSAAAFADHCRISCVVINSRIARTWLDRAVKEGKATVRRWRNDRGHDMNLYKWTRGGK